MNYFDRVLSRSDLVSSSKAEIQLLALTCLYLSVKLFQAGPILSTEHICMLSGSVFVPSQIVTMEQKILRSLEWCLYPPTSTEFLQPYLQILLSHSNLPVKVYAIEILESAQEIIHLMTLDYFFVANQFLPSHVAVAALVSAILSILPIAPNVPTMHDVIHVLSQFSDYRIDEVEVMQCCERLWTFMNTNYQQTFDETLNAPYCIPNAVRSDHHLTLSSTPNSPVGVTSYSQPFACREHISSSYGLIHPTANSSVVYRSFMTTPSPIWGNGEAF
jgi:Cyclin, N-terminal domain/Cyclin, C-terminal domain